MGKGRQRGDVAHKVVVAMRASVDVNAGHPQPERLEGFRGRCQGRWHRGG